MVKVEPTSPANDAFHMLREIGSRARRFPERLAARSAASRMRVAEGSEPLLNYGRLSPVAAGRPIGGEIKLLHLRRELPEHFDGFNVIYLVSSALPPQVEEVVRVAKRRGARLVWNQNGVAYPGCYGDFYPWFNLRMGELRSQADHIINQSEFSRLSAERYLGVSRAPCEILFNPVDTAVFSPAADPLPAGGPWKILAAGTSHALYRTRSVLETFREILGRGHDAHLTVAGEFRWNGAEKQVRREMRGLESRITLLPPFSQEEALGMYRSAHLLLHTKYNDPCPTVPIEAMSCGLPVVGTASGGMGELVPPQCGVLVPVAKGWEKDLAGDPCLLADAVEQVMANHSPMSAAARRHAVETFGVSAWLGRHGEIFREVLAR